MLQFAVLAVGVVVNFIGSFAYLRDTLAGRNQPNRVTFFLWGLAVFISAAAEVADGVRWAALPVFMAWLCVASIFTASFFNKKAYWKLRGLDYGCGAISLLALILWAVTREPVVAIVFAIASDFLAAVPTIRKSWTNPESEGMSVYLCGAFSAATSFVAIRDWRFSEYAFPGYLVCVDLTVFLIIWFRRTRGSLLGRF